MKHLILLFSLACTAIQLGTPGRADGHGFAGARFFPATLSTEDPFTADELSLPTFSTIRSPEDRGIRETDLSMELAKRITPDFALAVGETFSVLNPPDEETVSGFGNLELGAKYQILESDVHETIVSLGLEAEIGGTGSSSVDVDSFSTWTPGILFGKGFGDLPEGFRFLKPFALTGQASIAIPTSASSRSVTIDAVTGTRETEIEQNPNMLEWGFALEYSIPYLQSQVQDMHWQAPFDRLIPLVEFALETPLNRGAGGQTTGTINPGVLWAGQHFQLGAEAIIPINERTGNNIGVITQLHFYLDDLFPHSLGRPLFRGKP